MADKVADTADEQKFYTTRKGEFRTILFLVLIVAPALAVAFVGSYGLVVWLLQLVFGPPVQ